MTFSGNRSIAKVIPLIYQIVEEEGYKVNRGKTRLQYSFQRQEVTGLIVNEKVSVSEKVEAEIKNAIYFIKKYGVSDHMRHIGCEKLFYKEHIYGIAYFINMVDKEKGRNYLKELDSLNWE